MFCRTKYAKFEDIPEFARADFEQAADGSWIMKQDAIEGAPEHFNAGLASNRDRALQQLKDANAARDAANSRASNAENQLANITAGGGRVISAGDAQSFEEYRKLGDVKTLTAKIQKADTDEKELASLKGEKGWQEIAEKTGLNFEALKEWFSHPTRGAGMEPFLKTEEREVEENVNGVISKVKKPVAVAYLRKTQNINGNNVQTEVELLTEAKGILPEFQFTALTAKPNVSGNEQTGGTTQGEPNVFGQQQFGQPTGGQQPVQTAAPNFALPMLGGGGQQTSGGQQTQQPLPVAQAFQAERDSKPNPFAPKK